MREILLANAEADACPCGLLVHFGQVQAYQPQPIHDVCRDGQPVGSRGLVCAAFYGRAGTGSATGALPGSSRCGHDASNLSEPRRPSKPSKSYPRARSAPRWTPLRLPVRPARIFSARVDRAHARSSPGREAERQALSPPHGLPARSCAGRRQPSVSKEQAMTTTAINPVINPSSIDPPHAASPSTPPRRGACCSG